jgi:hypothetical protein
MPVWALPALSWLISFYFMAGFVANVGFPPHRELLTGDFLFVASWLFFLFLPFFHKIKIGSVLELERQVEKAKEQAAEAKAALSEFKAEVRNTLQVLSTNVNTIGGMNNQITVNLPALAELQEARKLVEEKAPDQAKQKAAAVEEQISWQSDDPTFALARMRIEIERLLRRGLRLRTQLPDSGRDSIQYMSLSRLFDLFLKEYPDFYWLRDPFRAAVAASNAAIHAQQVPDRQAEEALALGAEIIATLQGLFPDVD